MIDTHVGLIGWPVEHSLSPAMHNAAFRALGLNWRYDLLPIPPDQLETSIQDLIALGYRGFNVTAPHKQAVLELPQIAEVDPDTAVIGAANTLTVLPEGKLQAANTDWRGFSNDLIAHGVNVSAATCVILGTGGSSKAVAYALKKLGAAKVMKVSRSPNLLGGVLAYHDLPDFIAAGEGTLKLIVNCTPVGTYPDADASPWPDAVPLPAGVIFYDLIYNPPNTKLTTQVKTSGGRAIGGRGMLVQQAALSFQHWVGQVPPLEIMRNAAVESLYSWEQ